MPHYLHEKKAMIGIYVLYFDVEIESVTINQTTSFYDHSNIPFSSLFLRFPLTVVFIKK